MKSNQHLIAGILARYVRHEYLGEEEIHLLETWWQESEEHRQLTRILQDAEVVRLEMEKDPDRSARMWEQMSKRLDEAKMARIKHQPAPVIAFFRRRWPYAAAALLSIAIVTYRYRWKFAQTKEEATTQLHHAQRGKAIFTLNDGSTIDPDTVALGGIVETAGFDTLRKIADDYLAFNEGSADITRIPGFSIGPGHWSYAVRMPDGTVAHIHTGTDAILNFDRKMRHIWLPGAGMVKFDVNPDPARPLVVHLRNASVEDIGTSFVVKVDDKKPETKITLLSGLVRVRGDGGSLNLTRRWQQALVDKGPPQLREEDDTVGLVRWSDSASTFHFDHVPLGVALQQVAFWYKCTIVYKDNVKGKPLLGEMRKTPSLDDVVTNIRVGQRLFADVKKQGNAIIVSKWSDK